MDTRPLRLAGDDFERELLGSADNDAPSSIARERVLGTLGLAGISASTALGTCLATSPAAAAAATGGGAATASAAVPGLLAGAATAAAPEGAGVALGVVTKWLAVSLACGLGSTALVREVAVPLIEPATPATFALATLPAASPMAAAPASPVTAADQEGAQPAPTTALAAAVVATAEPESGAPRRQVAEEIASLDRARSAVAQGDPATAERLLWAYARRFPRGVLAPEAAALRLEALAARGDPERTREAAQLFLAEHGTGPHAARARGLLALPRAAAASPAAPPSPSASQAPLGTARFHDAE